MSADESWLSLFFSQPKSKQYFYELLNKAQLSPDEALAECLKSTKPCHHPAELSKQWLTRSEQGFIAYPDLPSSLKEINDPPIGLFYQGDITLLERKIVAIVGSRKPTPAGLDNSRQFAYALASSDIVICSGLAKGIDTVAHQMALQADGGTIAVLGQGLNHYYPSANQALQKDISKRGLVLSEYAPDCAVQSWHFPRRNRIISALSEGVLVTEAALKSGSLITARLAAEQGRQVFAIPGDIQNPMAAGCHHLIREGAQLVSHPREIMAAIFWTEPQQIAFHVAQQNHTKLTETEQLVFQALDRTPRHLDIIMARAECELTLVLDALFSLELKGMIISSIDGYYKPNQGDTC